MRHLVSVPVETPTSGFDYLGADPIEELQAAERRKQKAADEAELRSLPSRVGHFLLDHKYWILGGLATVGLVLLNWPANPESWHPDFGPEVERAKKRRLPPVRSYAALGASSAMRESAMRMRKGAREDEKYYIKQALQAEKAGLTRAQKMVRRA